MCWSEVTARRMERHALTKPATGAASCRYRQRCCAEPMRRCSARPSSSIGRRIAGGTRTDVQHALWTDRTLIKTFGPRGTVHLLPTRDLPTWTGALSALPSSVPSHPDPVRFTSAQADEVIAAIGDALAEEDLTVDELTDEIRKRTGPWAVERTMDAFQTKWPRWRQLTSTAAHRGVLCFGPDRGRNVTYTNPHRWLPGFRPAGGVTALRTSRRALPVCVWSGVTSALREMARDPTANRGGALRRDGGRPAGRRDGGGADVDPGRRHRDSAAAPRHPAPPVLRPVRRRRSAAESAVSWAPPAGAP